MARAAAGVKNNKDLISLSDIVERDEFLAVSQQFETRSANTGQKRIFSITKQPIKLSE